MTREEMFEQYPQETIVRFNEFHAVNPQVYENFKDLARRMRATGKRRYSAQAIIYALRWEYDLRTTGEVFQINNDYTSIYARLLCMEDPSFQSFFELRRMPNHGITSDEQRRREGR